MLDPAIERVTGTLCLRSLSEERRESQCPRAPFCHRISLANVPSLGYWQPDVSQLCCLFPQGSHQGSQSPVGLVGSEYGALAAAFLHGLNEDRVGDQCSSIRKAKTILGIRKGGCCSYSFTVTGTVWAVTRVDLAGKLGKWPRAGGRGQLDGTKQVWNDA